MIGQVVQPGCQGFVYLGQGQVRRLCRGPQHFPGGEDGIPALLSAAPLGGWVEITHGVDGIPPEFQAHRQV